MGKNILLAIDFQYLDFIKQPLTKAFAKTGITG